MGNALLPAFIADYSIVASPSIAAMRTAAS